MFFFFKQKTAYEMRISDWSSDVCSSDLGLEHHVEIRGLHALAVVAHRDHFHIQSPRGGDRAGIGRALRRDEARCVLQVQEGEVRSEENTSELQSLLRTSYAVFCLKKKQSTNVLTVKRHRYNSKATR